MLILKKSKMYAAVKVRLRLLFCKIFLSKHFPNNLILIGYPQSWKQS